MKTLLLLSFLSLLPFNSFASDCQDVAYKAALSVDKLNYPQFGENNGAIVDISQKNDKAVIQVVFGETNIRIYKVKLSKVRVYETSDMSETVHCTVESLNYKTR